MPAAAEDAAADADSPTVRFDDAVPTVDAAPIGTLTDSEMLRVLAVLDFSEATFGNLAAQRARNADVKAFAASVASAQRAAQSEVDGLAEDLALTPTDSDFSIDVESAAGALAEFLRTARAGEEFDRSYVTTQVIERTQVLEYLDRMRAAADAPALRTFVGDMQAQVRERLVEAGRVLRGLAE